MNNIKKKKLKYEYFVKLYYTYNLILGYTYMVEDKVLNYRGLPLSSFVFIDHQ